MHYYGHLQHHGIKGQKWGIRRFQNTDGSYTNEGKRRRQGSLKNLIEKSRKASPSRRYSDMSDEELERRIRRKRNEIALDDLEFDASIPAGLRYIKNAAINGTSRASTSLVSDVTYTLGKRYIQDKYGIDLGKGNEEKKDKKK